ncbi:hypothetical protein GIB67_015091, partial [Kingdonia uniflora]
LKNRRSHFSLSSLLHSNPNSISRVFDSLPLPDIMSRHPEIKWAQREDKVYLTVLLSDAKNTKVNLEPEGVFSFSGSAGSGDNLYEVKLNLFDKVNVEESKINTGLRSIFCVIEKAEKGWWKKLLRGDEKTPHYVKVDWDKWVDEDEDTGPAADMDTGGMDFSKFGGMEGMGGMPGMGGMGGGMDMASMMAGMGGGMGGMGGGMGGMDMASMMAGMGGGMGGMGGGMGDDLDEVSDDEDEGDEKSEGKALKTEDEVTESKTEAAPST